LEQHAQRIGIAQSAADQEGGDQPIDRLLGFLAGLARRVAE